MYSVLLTQGILGKWPICVMSKTQVTGAPRIPHSRVERGLFRCDQTHFTLGLHTKLDYCTILLCVLFYNPVSSLKWTGIWCWRRCSCLKIEDFCMNLFWPSTEGRDCEDGVYTGRGSKRCFCFIIASDLWLMYNCTISFADWDSDVNGSLTVGYMLK